MRVSCHFNRLLCLLAAAWLASPPTVVVAQANTNPVSPGLLQRYFPDQARAAAEKANESFKAAATNTAAPKYDLEIKEGMLIWNGPPRKDNASGLAPTLGSVIELLNEQHPDANFVLGAGLEEVKIGNLKLRGATIEDKLEAVRIAAGGDTFAWRHNQNQIVDPTTGMPMSGADAGNGLYVIEGRPGDEKPAVQIEAFDCKRYLAVADGSDEALKAIDRKVTGIMRLIEETVVQYRDVRDVSRAPAIKMPSIRFHEELKLLVVIGEPEAVRVVSKVVGALIGIQRPEEGRPGQKF